MPPASWMPFSSASASCLMWPYMEYYGLGKGEVVSLADVLAYDIPGDGAVFQCSSGLSYKSYLRVLCVDWE